MSTYITYVGHATVLIETQGVRILTDPLLRNRLLHLRRYTGSVEADWYRHLDAVLISHLHLDHFDVPSLQMLDRSTHIIAPPGSRAILGRHGFEQVTELDVGETTRIGPATIEATYAEHTGRIPFVQSPDDALGFLIHADHKIYFAGDTDLFTDMATLSDELDVGLLPVWGWGPTVGVGHLDPHRAAESLPLLQPKLAIPIHWGTFIPLGLRRLMPDLLTMPPATFERAASRMAPTVDVCVLHPGTRLFVDERLDTTA